MGISAKGGKVMNYDVAEIFAPSNVCRRARARRLRGGWRCCAPCDWQDVGLVEFDGAKGSVESVVQDKATVAHGFSTVYSSQGWPGLELETMRIWSTRSIWQRECASRSTRQVVHFVSQHQLLLRREISLASQDSLNPQGSTL